MRSTQQPTTTAEIKAKINELDKLNDRISYLSGGLKATNLKLRLAFSDDCSECGMAAKQVIDGRKELESLVDKLTYLSADIKQMSAALDPKNSFLNKDAV